MDITEENGPVLREMLQRNSTLEDLDLSVNREMSDTGAIFITQGLKQNSSLRKLDLCSCGIDDEGVESLGEALVENDSLKVLWLKHNYGISERGLSVLSRQTEDSLTSGSQVTSDQLIYRRLSML